MTNNDRSNANVESTSKRRTFWDVLPALSTFLSTVVLGVVALVVNSSYSERQSIRAREAQEQQHQLNRVQTLAAFMPHLSSTQETREAALFGISLLGYPDLAIRLAQLHKPDKPQSGRDVGDTIMREASASAPVRASTEEPVPATQPAIKEIGWVYLGNYSGGKWSTQYLDFASAAPEKLVGQTYATTGPLNVRVGMPTEQGDFPRIIRALPPGERVRILELRPWLTTGYIWARVVAA